MKLHWIECNHEVCREHALYLGAVKVGTIRKNLFTGRWEVECFLPDANRRNMDSWSDLDGARNILEWMVERWFNRIKLDEHTRAAVYAHSNES